MFKLEFKTDNAAFDEGMATECGRILRALAASIEQHGGDRGYLFDSNGNNVGSYSVTK